MVLDALKAPALNAALASITLLTLRSVTLAGMRLSTTPSDHMIWSGWRLRTHAACRTIVRLGADGLSLTAASRRLLPQALEAEAALLKEFNAVQGLDREASGRIRLSADPMTAHYLLAAVLADFAALYPEIEIELRLAYTLDSIARNETDVSICHARRSRMMP